MQQDFTDEQRDILEKCEKLMRLAAKNPNEHEAAAASAKAMELLAAHNLSQAALESEGSQTGGKRAEEKLVGGFYEFERDLWRAIAELNFCWYFTTTKYIPTTERKKHRGRTWTHQHVLIGRPVNIAGTKAMAAYLMQTIERLTKERTEPSGIHPRSSWATSFRRGIAERVEEKVNRRRWEQLREEEQKEAEARERANAATAGQGSTSTGLTLSSVRQSEYEANFDFQYGEGAYAKAQEDRARRAEARRKADEEYTQWAADHPEEAAKQEAEALKERRRREARSSSRRSSAPAFKGDYSAYAMGREAGEKVGIDQQAESRRASALLK